MSRNAFNRCAEEYNEREARLDEIRDRMKKEREDQRASAAQAPVLQVGMPSLPDTEQSEALPNRSAAGNAERGGDTVAAQPAADRPMRTKFPLSMLAEDAALPHSATEVELASLGYTVRPHPTPRTDARVFKMLSGLQSGTQDVVSADFARELERELADAEMRVMRKAEHAAELEAELAELRAGDDYEIGYRDGVSEIHDGLKHDIARQVAIASEYATDSERYRWLIEQMSHERSGPHIGWTLGTLYEGDDPESAIDKARAEEKT